MRPLFLAAFCGLCLVAPSAHGSTFLDRKLGDWLTELKSGKPTARRSAAFALGRMGRDAILALPDLARCVERETDNSVRDMATFAIGSIVLDSPTSASRYWRDTGSALESALESKDARVRRSAAYALGAFGKSASSSAANLRKATKDKDATVRQNAAWALGQLGGGDASTVVELCDLLRDSSEMVRRDAATALDAIGKSSGRKAVQPAAKPLLDMVKGEKDEVAKKTALNALATLAGPEHADYASDLYDLLDSKDEDTARGAAYVLGNMGGEPAKKALPTLKKALADSDPSVQALAAATLANAGPAAADAVDDLARTLKSSKDPVVRQNCCVAISHLEAEGKSAIPELIEAMKPGTSRTAANERVRQLAAEALAQIRYPHNQEAMPAVRDTLAKDRDQIVRQRCVWAMFNIPEDDLEKHGLTKTLTEVLDEKGDASLMVRYDSARLLAYTLRENAPARTIDVLLHMIGNKTLRVFNKTDANIKGAGSEASKGSSGLDDDLGGDARYMAAVALGRMRDAAKNDKRVVAALRDAAKDRDAQLKKEALESLEALGLKAD